MKIIAVSPVTKSILKTVEKISDEGSSVVFTGETGVGKTLFAKYLHYKSFRKYEPFLEVRLTEIPETLIEGEVLGIEKGSATGVRAREGILSKVRKGTLCLTGFEDVSFKTQALFLRVLETKSFEKIGGNRKLSFEGRIVAEFINSPKKLIQDKRLRADLYYRLSVFEVYIPPLRERREEIVPLFEYFLDKACKKYKRGKKSLDDSFKDMLLRYEFNGNVRELKNIAENFALKEGNLLRKEDFLQHLLIDEEALLNYSLQNRLTLEEMKNAYIGMVLNRVGGNKSEASKWLNISRKTLWEYLKSRKN